jgi:hypothetical protein
MATSTEFWTSSAYGPGTGGTYELQSARSPNRYHLMRILRKKGMREFGEIVSTLLTDSTPSTSAGVTISQLTAEADTSANVQGGVRTIAAKEIMGGVLDSDKDDASANTARAVTSADVSSLQEELVMSGDQINRAPTNGSGTITYATDASGNGGGGKLD